MSRVECKSPSLCKVSFHIAGTDSARKCGVSQAQTKGSAISSAPRLSQSPSDEPVAVMDSSGEYVHIVPGERDYVAYHAYLNGQCLALALAVSHRTGWPIALRTFDEEPEDHAPFLIHAYVQSPDGILIDYTGGNEKEALEEDWDEAESFTIIPASESGSLLEQYDPVLADQDVDLAESFVDGVLGIYRDDWTEQ